ncbi:MAG: hypothetical protein ACKO9H_09255, partial [Planctomycetota bacterium]
MSMLSRFSNRGLRIFRSNSEKQASNPSGKQRVLFVSHEATRTGAPMIILNILKHFSQTCDVQCETILHNGGHLVGDFKKFS